MTEPTVLPLTYVEQMKLAADVVGASMSQSWWNTATVAASVRAIDGRKVMKPKHPAHLRKIIEQLGDDGWRQAVIDFNRFVPECDESMTITTRPVSTTELWDLSEFSGTLFDIPPWRGLALVAVSVRSVNGTDLDFPTSTRALYERVELLGWHGMNLAVEMARDAAEKKNDDTSKEPQTGN